MDSIYRDEKALSRAITAAEKDGRKRVTDGGGMFLLLTVKGGGRAWRLDYTFGGKRKQMSLGVHPDVTLVQARRKRNEAWALLEGGKDPSAERQTDRKAVQAVAVVEKLVARGGAIPGSFRAVFEEWHQTRSSGWSPSYAEKTKARITNDILPWLGDLPIGSIDEKALLECLRRVQARGAIESAHSTLQNCGQVFRFGVATGQCSRNPAQGMSGALTPVIVKHMAAIIAPDRFAQLLATVNGYHGSITTRYALLILAMTFQRPGNVRAMRWADLDLDGGMWSIPSDDMKRTVQQKASGRPHLVPLCPEAVAILRELHPLTGKGAYVFVAEHTSLRPMSENTLNMALRRMGIAGAEQTSHGFRTSARTIAVERMGVDPEIAEAQLAHKKSGPRGGAYDRAEYMAQRVAMMALWGRTVASCAKGEPFPIIKPAKPAGDQIDMATVAALLAQLTGKPVTAEVLKTALAVASKAAAGS